MAATIRLANGVSAVADGYAWRCADPVMTKLLNTLLDPYGPSGADPNPDYTLAQRAVGWLGGEITAFDATENDEIEPPEGGDRAG